jgi:dephospho-CoA kinase
MHIIIITGMPGSGKSELAGLFHSAGYPIITMGDVIREETRRRGLEPNPENTRAVMLQLRETDGPGAVARRCVDMLRNLTYGSVVIEGCRSIAELDEFQKLSSDMRVICVHSSPATRFKRLRNRGREDAPPDWATFRERDIREISVGLGGVIALSDTMVVNEGTLKEFSKKARPLTAEAERNGD